jgi:hypothetical protein
MAVSTGAIVEGLDVVVDLGCGELPGCVDALLDPLLLQAAKKGFGHCVIPTVATSTHAGLKVMRSAEAPPRIAAKLGTLIGVNQGMLGLASSNGHEERVQHEVLSQRGIGGPADNTAGVQVHHDGQIEPAFPRAHVCDVGDPGVVWALNGKTALQRIRSKKSGDASGVPRRAIAMERFDVIGPHNPSDAMLATGLARFAQIEKDPRGSVDPVACV